MVYRKTEDGDEQLVSMWTCELCLRGKRTFHTEDATSWVKVDGGGRSYLEQKWEGDGMLKKRGMARGLSKYVMDG